ncbi:MAG: DUF4403 family protein [Candidatus Eisenbacteria bacterium]
MIRASRRAVLVLAGFVLVVAVGLGLYVWDRISSPLVLDAPPPRVVSGPNDLIPKVPESVIEALVTYNLSTAVDSLEAAIPRKYGDIEQRLPIASNTRASFGFTVSRSPFRVQLAGSTLSISADVEYQGRVWYRPPIGPELSAGCGVGDDPRPRVRASLESATQLTPRWDLRTKTRVLHLETYSDGPRDRCRLTVLRIDATDRVIEATRNMLEQKVQKFDEAVTRWPVRAKFVRLWAMLQRPIFLTEGVYLEINPHSAELGSVGAVGDTVMARLRMIASPRVVTGARTDSIQPLPLLGAASNIGSGAHVVVEASFTYPVATALLRRSLVGRSIVQGGNRIRIRDVQISGIGDGRVALGVTLAGRVRGRLYFTGTPSLDPVNQQIHVPDLDYDVGTEQMLVQGFAWLKGMDMRDFLRERARLPDSAVVGKLRGLAEGGINRTLAEGVRLSGRIHDAQGTSVIATTQEIRLRAVADAEFKISIDRGPTLPRPPQMARAEGD